MRCADAQIGLPNVSIAAGCKVFSTQPCRATTIGQFSMAGGLNSSLLAPEPIRFSNIGAGVPHCSCLTGWLTSMSAAMGPSRRTHSFSAAITSTSVHTSGLGGSGSAAVSALASADGLRIGHLAGLGGDRRRLARGLLGGDGGRVARRLALLLALVLTGAAFGGSELQQTVVLLRRNRFAAVRGGGGSSSLASNAKRSGCLALGERHFKFCFSLSLRCGRLLRGRRSGHRRGAGAGNGRDQRQAHDEGYRELAGDGIAPFPQPHAILRGGPLLLQFDASDAQHGPRLFAVVVVEVWKLGRRRST